MSSGKEKDMTNKKRRGNVFAAAVAVTAVIAALLAFFCFRQIETYEDGLIDISAGQQDAYVKLVLDQIYLKDNRDSADIINNILGTLDSSGSRYWTLSESHTMLYIQNVTGYSQYRNLTAESYYSSPDSAAFFDSLKERKVTHSTVTIDGRSYVASGAAFTYNGTAYKLCLLSSRDALLNNNRYLSAKVNLWIIMAVFCVLIILLPSYFAFRYRRQQVRNDLLHEENERLGKNLESAGRKLYRRAFASAYLRAGKGVPVKAEFKHYYQMKFYLNARHYIWIDGEKGDAHPHTWEFGLTIGIDSRDFVEFSVFERSVNAFLEPYQNQLLNEMAPFDAVVPTLENMTDEFASSFADCIAEAGGTLLRIEASETPTRSYVVEIDVDGQGSRSEKDSTGESNA